MATSCLFSGTSAIAATANEALPLYFQCTFKASNLRRRYHSFTVCATAQQNKHPVLHPSSHKHATSPLMLLS